MPTASEERIAIFCKKGKGYEDFIRLAAQPLLFSTDLLYKLWLNFRAYKHKNPKEQADYLVVSDLILSSLCRPVGVDLFRMEESIRQVLLPKLKKTTQGEVATFVAEYAAHNRANLSRNIYEVYTIWAKGILNPKAMEQQIIEKLQTDVSDYQKMNYLSLYFNAMPTDEEGETPMNIRLEYAEQGEDNVLRGILSRSLVSFIKSNDKVDEYINYEGVSIPHKLTPMPFLPNEFTGRDKELIEIREAFRSYNKIKLVNGQGGIGKTAFAAKYYHIYHKEYVHVAWLFVEKEMTDMLFPILKTLTLKVDSNITPGDTVKLLNDKLNKLHSPCLIIFDNVNDDDDLNTLISRFNAPNCHVIITTRLARNQHNIYSLDLDRLSIEEASNLFKRYYQFTLKEEKLFIELWNLVNGNTLALETAAKILNQRNQKDKNYKLSVLLDDFQKEDFSNPYTILQSEISNLERTELEILTTLHLFQPEWVNTDILEGFFPNISRKELDAKLHFLSHKSLLFESDTHFTSNLIVSELISNEITRGVSDVLTTLITNKLDNQLNDYKFTEQKDLLIRYGERLISKGNTTNKYRADLCNSIGEYYLSISKLTSALEYFKKSTVLNKELQELYPQNEEYKNGLALSYSSIGKIYLDLKKFKDALEFFQGSLSLNIELYESYAQNIGFKSNLALSYSNLGNVYSNLQYFEQALVNFKNGIIYAKELYVSYPQSVAFKQNLAYFYSSIGNNYLNLEQFEQALEYFEWNATLNKELYEIHPQNVDFKKSFPSTYSYLVESYSRSGNLENAFELYMLIKELYKLYLQDKLPSRIAIKSTRHTDYVPIDDIVYLKADDNLTCIHTADKRYFAAKSLGSFTNQLVDYPFLIRLHRSYIVNVNHIKSIKRGGQIFHVIIDNRDNSMIPISINRANKLFDFFKSVSKLIRGLHKFLPSKKLPSRIAIKSTRHTDYVPIDDIVYLKADGNLTCIHTADKRYFAAKSLGSFTNQLVDYPFLIRLHRSYIVNVNHITAVQKHDKKTYLIMDDNDKSRISVSASKVHLIKEKLEF